ncbi:uncharacterized protein LOC119485735 isoform X1 [Sebastes umbrosus]|uniref:uncharacterized protein LOC119485735 isoform X1 n=1 Tax=Sebastes umbrosus TaxID=72105 RepID=UPI00189E860F|nr:uncharacterized protein LOC119485735 isoform X1 [Sebastes umbrosus]
MQLLCVATLLLSAVAAQPDFWPDERSPPPGGPQTEDGDGEFDGVWPQWVSGHPVWQDEMPSWLPDTRPENGNPPMKGTDGDDHQPGRPSQVSARGKRQAPGFTSDGPGVPPPGPGRQFERRRGSSGGKRPNRRDPSTMVFSPMFKVDNVAFQNVTDVTLKEGETLFLMPRHGGRGHHHQKGGRHGPPKTGQYVKLIYKAAEPNKVSIEVGVSKPMNPGEFFGVEDHPEEDY